MEQHCITKYLHAHVQIQERGLSCVEKELSLYYKINVCYGLIPSLHGHMGAWLTVIISR